MIEVEEFRTEVRQWLADNLVGDYAALKGLGGPGREHEAFEGRLAWNQHLAKAGLTCLGWPEEHGARNEYDLASIKRVLGIFLWRFFKTSQFKRSCVPNGPKVGNGGSLSPRGDWRMPSDVSSAAWLAEIERNVPTA